MGIGLFCCCFHYDASHFVSLVLFVDLDDWQCTVETRQCQVQRGGRVMCCAMRYKGKLIQLSSSVRDCAINLSLSALSKILADILKYFIYFSQKVGFDISCKLSPLETNCMKCQILFYGITITNLLSAEYGHRVVKVKYFHIWLAEKLLKNGVLQSGCCCRLNKNNPLM